MVFSPDGTQLIVLLMDQPQIRVWDLRAVREHLAELELNWRPSLTESPAARSPGFGPPPPPYRVDRGRVDEWFAERRRTSRMPLPLTRRC